MAMIDAIGRGRGGVLCMCVCVGMSWSAHVLHCQSYQVITEKTGSTEESGSRTVGWPSLDHI